MTKLHYILTILLIGCILSGCCAKGEMLHRDLCIPDCKENLSCVRYDRKVQLRWDGERYRQEALEEGVTEWMDKNVNTR